MLVVDVTDHWEYVGGLAPRQPHRSPPTMAST